MIPVLFHGDQHIILLQGHIQLHHSKAGFNLLHTLLLVLGRRAGSSGVFHSHTDLLQLVFLHSRTEDLILVVNIVAILDLSGKVFGISKILDCVSTVRT